jgi:hypothetical protein
MSDSQKNKTFEVFYTGTGANKSGRHTRKRFMQIIQKEFVGRKGTENYTYDDWLVFANAVDMIAPRSMYPADAPPNSKKSRKNSVNIQTKIRIAKK